MHITIKATSKTLEMNNIVITIRSSEIPDIPNLEAIDSEKLLKDIISQLSSGKYQIIGQEPGPLVPIEGYKDPYGRIRNPA